VDILGDAWNFGDAKNSAYKSVGVDIDAATRTKELIKPLARSTARPEVIGGIGFFGGFFGMPQDYKDPVLVSSTDSVGTKENLATQMHRLDTIGIDIVNHCINDIFVGGAEPLFFLDYIGLGRLVPEEVEEIVRGLATACRAGNVALIGGETAQLPSLYKPGDFDLVGFIVGVVERDKIISGSKIREGDVLLGLPSSGLHTNGYTLARRVFRTDEDPAGLTRVWPELGRTLGDALLEPHRAYFPLLKPALPLLKGMAHITGGGFLENIPRVLPEGLGCYIRRDSWRVPPLFTLLQRLGDIEQAEMDRVFNQGIGMVLMVSPGDVEEIVRLVPEAIRMGTVVKRTEGQRVQIG
jgi:phosphoribosylformylglycinamidine cyclo-ligase